MCPTVVATAYRVPLISYEPSLINTPERSRALHGTHIRLTLHPDQAGAKGLRAEDGERVVCVRYRYDTQKPKRYKTVELVIAEEHWTPPRVPPAPEQVVAIRVAAVEGTIRQPVKSAGGQWDPRRGVWRLRYAWVVTLGLRERIVEAEDLSR